MMSPAGNGSNSPQTWSSRLLGAFTSPRGGTGGSDRSSDPGEILPPEERKAAMSGLDDLETKLSLGAFVLAAIAAIAAPAYFVTANKVTRAGKNSIPIAPDALLLGGLILVLCLIGFLALWKRKRTLVTFDLFLIGFALTILITLVGFAFIFLGAWLMLRAWRINKYGTTNSKAIASQVRDRPRGRDRKEAAKTGGTASAKSPARSGTPRPPTANKRYTPKSAPRKKIPKPTE